MYKIKYESGEYKIVQAESIRDVIKKHDLCTQENANTRVIKLGDEQEAIAISNLE